MQRRDGLIHDPALQEATHAGADTDEVALIARIDDALAVPPALIGDVRLITRFGDISTLRVKRRSLQAFAALPEVAEVEVARQIFDPHRDLPALRLPHSLSSRTCAEERPVWPRYTRRPTEVTETGAGVVIGVLDWGIDFAHPSFRHADGSTRLLGFWDQRGGFGSDSNRWGYGRIFSQPAINAALASAQPFEFLNYHPGDADSPDLERGWQGTHGTHVLDIAAGNGLGGGMPGVAPEADLCFVHLARTEDVLTLANLGDSISVCEGIDYIFRVAGNRPCVINMSVGAHCGPHDGSTCVERCIDRAVWLSDNRCIVNSAGNYFGARAHAKGRLRLGETQVLDVEVPQQDNTRSELEIHYESSDRLIVELISPDGECLARSRVGEHQALYHQGRRVGHLYHLEHRNANPDRLIDLFFYPQVTGGRWQIRLFGERIYDGRYHAWIERDRGLRPTFTREQSSGCHTTGTLCNGFYSITVGAHNPFRRGLPIGPYSSAGPTRDGRIKPELSAPGSWIPAAQSAPPGDAVGGQGGVTRKSGTSMAAPHVAGTVALMYEAARDPLSITELRALLFTSLQTPARANEPETIHRHGFGALDIPAAVEAARRWRNGRAEDVAEAMSAERVAHQPQRFFIPWLTPSEQPDLEVVPTGVAPRIGDFVYRQRPGEGLVTVTQVVGVAPDGRLEVVAAPRRGVVRRIRLRPTHDVLLRSRQRSSSI